MLGQHLGQVLLVEALVLLARQLDDAPSNCRLDRVVGRAASIAVCQAGNAQLPEAPVEALQLPLGDAEQRGRFLVDQGPRLEVRQDGDATLLSSVQNDPVPHGVTESPFASGVTDSLYSHTHYPNP